MGFLFYKEFEKSGDWSPGNTKNDYKTPNIWGGWE